MSWLVQISLVTSWLIRLLDLLPISDSVGRLLAESCSAFRWATDFYSVINMSSSDALFERLQVTFCRCLVGIAWRGSSLR